MNGRLPRLRNGLHARLNAFPWQRTDFTYLGVIIAESDYLFGWAWHADGRSIDNWDRAFDIVDWGRDPNPYFWLGADAENAND